MQTAEPVLHTLATLRCATALKVIHFYCVSIIYSGNDAAQLCVYWRVPTNKSCIRKTPDGHKSNENQQQRNTRCEIGTEIYNIYNIQLICTIGGISIVLL